MTTKSAIVQFRFSVRDDDTEPHVSYFVDARYPAQAWELRVHFDERPDSSDAAIEAIEAAFHAEHLRRNGIEDRASHVELLSWGIRAELVRLDKRARKFAVSDDSGPYRTDDIVFEGQSQRVPRSLGGGLATGDVVEGPAIIDEPTTTLVIPPHWKVRLDDGRNFRLERNGATA